MSKFFKMVIVTLTITFSINILTFAETSSSLQEKINQNQDQIDDLQNEKDKINNEISNQTSELQGILNEINEKSNELEVIKAEIESYQVKIDEIQIEIDSINQEIYDAEIGIESREKLIAEKEKEALRIKENIDKRLRSYYKIDVFTSYLYLIIKSENILSLFNNIQSIFRIINFDKSLVDEVKEIQAQLENEKLELANELIKIEEGKKIVVEKQEQLKDEQKVYLTKEEDHRSKMSELETLESEKTSMIASLEQEGINIESQIGDLIAYNTALQQELDNIFNNINNSPSVDNDGIAGDPNSETFLRPGNGGVTDDYGPRINPVTGEAGFHAGVDLGDPYGAPVYASKTGVVVYSGWISGYGNTIIIDHGSGVQTLYAHNSSLLFGVGDSVNRGQTIAYVGSTGMSTGPHIHWEIRINGQHINPMPYV